MESTLSGGPNVTESTLSGGTDVTWKALCQVDLM